VRDDTSRLNSLLLVSGVSFVLRCSAPWSIRHTSTGNPPAVRTGSANQEGGPTVRAAPNAIAVSAISLDLIRAHVSLIHRLAEPLKGWGKIVIACFGQTPDQVAVELGSARSGPLRVLRGRGGGRLSAFITPFDRKR
jgi:hypothetical protein